MAKYSNTKTAPKAVQHGPSKVVAKGKTFNGADGFVLDDKTGLFLLASTSFMQEKAYYESAGARDNRLIDLVHKVTKSDPEWIQRFIGFLRNEMNMRSAAIVVAAEYVQAGGPNARKVVNDAMSRADEPAEFLGYWAHNYYGWDGKTYPLPAPKLPQSVRKGMSDAVRRLYTEKSALKYNGNSRTISMGNVLNLVHTQPKDEAQSALFKYIIDRHHGNELDIEGLPKISEFNRLNALPVDQRRALLNDPVALRRAGFTWESLSGWLSGPMDAKAWEAMIEAGMGYMALLRNLRNFDEQGISKNHREMVIAKLTDPDEVASSRQFPFRFWSAFQSVSSLHWAPALEEALGLSVKNVPRFSGRTLVLTDISGSMGMAPSAKSKAYMYQIGAIFGAAMAYGQKGGADFVAFGTSSKIVDLPKGGSILKAVKAVDDTFRNNSVGHGTNIMPAINKHFKNHDRIVIFTDGQGNPGKMTVDVPNIHSFDLRGYGVTPFEIGKKGRYQYGGFSDKTFTLMRNFEAIGGGDWPF